MDHKAVEFFKTQQTMTTCQRWWIDYLSKLNFDITYVKGELNKVVDYLSCYYESDMSKDMHYMYDYVYADIQIDPEGDDLPSQRVAELGRHLGRHAEQLHACVDHNMVCPNWVRDHNEPCNQEAWELENGWEDNNSPLENDQQDNNWTLRDALASLGMRVHPWGVGDVKWY